MGRFNKYKRSRTGFTMPELLIATLVLALAFVGVVLSFVRSIELGELSRNSTRAVTAVNNQMDAILNTVPQQVFATFNNATFTVQGLNGIGVTYVDNASANFLTVTSVYCWQEKTGLVVGEDDNLNGQLNAGEDDNGNGLLDSPVMAVTTIYMGAG